MAKAEVKEKWVLMTELNGEPLLHHFKLSNFGNVVRIKKGSGPEEPFIPKEIGGYAYLSFTTRNKSRETIYVHRLVAEFFVPNTKEEATYVIHKDYDRRNNRFDNLQWVSQEVLYKHRAHKAGRIAGRKNKPATTAHIHESHGSRLQGSELAQKQALTEFLGIGI